MTTPEILVNSETEKMKHDLKEKLVHLGLDYKNYLERFRKTEGELEKEFTEEAKKRVEIFLVMREITKKEKIEATPEEIEEKSSKDLKQFASAGEAQKSIDISQLKEYTKGMLENEKVFQLLESY